MIRRLTLLAFLAAAAVLATAAGNSDLWRKRPAGFAWGVDFSGSRTTSPNGIAATLAGNASVSSRKLVLDGTGDWITTDDAAGLDVGDDFSVSVWVQPNAPGTGATRIPVARYLAGSNKRSWVLSLRYADTPQRVFGVVGEGAAALIIYAFNQTLPTTGWHHYVMVYSKSAGAGLRVRLYYDGAEVPVSTLLADVAASPFATDIGLRIGNDNDGTSATAWKGDIGTTILLNRAITQSEASSLYNTGAARIAAGGTP